jgi:hypothetical protein
VSRRDILRKPMGFQLKLLDFLFLYIVSPMDGVSESDEANRLKGNIRVSIVLMIENGFGDRENPVCSSYACFGRIR